MFPPTCTSKERTISRLRSESKPCLSFTLPQLSTSMGISVFLKVLAIFTKKNDKSAPKIFHKKSHKKKRFQLQNSRIFTKKKRFGLQNPHFSLKILEFSQKKTPAASRPDFHKKNHKKERRFAPIFHKKKRYSFFFVNIFVKKH